MNTLRTSSPRPTAAARQRSPHSKRTQPRMVQDLIAANSWSSGDTTYDGSSGGSGNSAPASKNTSPVSRPASSRSSSGGSTNPSLSWDFRATAAAASAQLGSSHIISARKRRERMYQQFIELSTVIPGHKKMDKATILSDVTKYVKELQEKVKDLERRSIELETMVLVKRPYLHAAAASSGMPPPERKQLPDIEAWFSEKSVTVRIHCEDSKGVAVMVLSKIEELHLRIVHATILPFAGGTLIITIMAKVEEGFDVTEEAIVGRLYSALLHNQHDKCRKSTDE